MKKTVCSKAVPASFAERYSEVNGVQMHYFIGGKGSPVVLLHGYTQTSHMWIPNMSLLAQYLTVIVQTCAALADQTSLSPDLNTFATLIVTQ
ncbi:MAG: alpha/beta fold hydrolase [Dissulfurispiraceae bacterium]